MRLITPAKNELGRLSKFIFKAVNKELRHKLNLNQRKNTDGAFDWFKSMKDKQHWKFVSFDINDFYPSIKESLFKQYLDFEEKYIKLPVKTKPSSNMRKSLFFSTNKKSGSKKKVDYLMWRWVRMMVLRFENLFEFFYFISSRVYTTATT